MWILYLNSRVIEHKVNDSSGNHIIMTKCTERKDPSDVVSCFNGRKAVPPGSICEFVESWGILVIKLAIFSWFTFHFSKITKLASFHLEAKDVGVCAMAKSLERNCHHCWKDIILEFIKLIFVLNLHHSLCPSIGGLTWVVLNVVIVTQAQGIVWVRIWLGLLHTFAFFKLLLWKQSISGTNQQTYVGITSGGKPLPTLSVLIMIFVSLRIIWICRGAVTSWWKYLKPSLLVQGGEGAVQCLFSITCGEGGENGFLCCDTRPLTRWGSWSFYPTRTQLNPFSSTLSIDFCWSHWITSVYSMELTNMVLSLSKSTNTTGILHFMCFDWGRREVTMWSFRFILHNCAITTLGNNNVHV